MNPIDAEQTEAFRRFVESDTQEIPIVRPVRLRRLPRWNSARLQPLLKTLRGLVERR